MEPALTPSNILQTAGKGLFLALCSRSPRIFTAFGFTSIENWTWAQLAVIVKFPNVLLKDLSGQSSLAPWGCTANTEIQLESGKEFSKEKSS